MVSAELGGDLAFLPFLREEEFERGAVQDPKHRGAWPPEDHFRAQNSNMTMAPTLLIFVVIHLPVLSQTVLDL